jgi:hypothetical protein
MYNIQTRDNSYVSNIPGVTIFPSHAFQMCHILGPGWHTGYTQFSNVMLNLHCKNHSYSYCETVNKASNINMHVAQNRDQ